MSEPKLSLYRNRDRELMFHGTVEEAKAAHIRINSKVTPWQVRIEAKRYNVVNHSMYRGGDVGLWLSSEITT